MKKTLTLLSTLALLAGTTATVAQDTTADQPQTEESTSEAPPAPDAPAGGAPTPEAEAQGTAQDGTPAETAGEGETTTGGPLDLGQDVPGQEQPGRPETYIKETFTDWALQCLKVQEGDEVCQMYQLLKEEGGANVAEVSLFKLQDGGRAVAGGTFIVPLETLLPAKLTIQVDNGQPRQYEYSFCAQIGCYARVGFTQEDINRFKAGAKATVTLVPALAPDQKVAVDMSLSGFTAAFNEVSSLRQ